MLSPIFLERLEKIIPSPLLEGVIKTFSDSKGTSVRVNSIRSSVDEVVAEFDRLGLVHSKLPWSNEALHLKNTLTQEIRDEPYVSEGKIYLQDLSSMLPSIALNPKSGEKVLDMCAAPGSKTTHMASMMQNEGGIIALDVVRSRVYKLKSNCERMGVQNTQIKCLDSRRYFPKDEVFDKILLDAPCSSEGRFKETQPKTLRFWSLRKIKEMVHKQKGLLGNAVRLLRPGGVLVYSTCTFAPEENEANVDWILKKMKGKLSLEKISLKGVPTYPSVSEWNNRVFENDMSQTVRVLPDGTYSAFFMAKFMLE